MNEKKYIIGLVTPEILNVLETTSMHPLFLDVEICNALEIRYDFFPEEEWLSLSKRIRHLAPHALQIGTIRLKRDGGNYDDNKALSRTPLWEEILSENEKPEWIDLERDALFSLKQLSEITKRTKTKILVSEHNFCRIPTELELKKFAEDLRRLKIPGLKIAAMSCSPNDTSRLYKFIQKYAKYFEFFGAFGMGKTGKASRMWSLKEGANLTYGAFGEAAAPGQIDIPTMGKIMEQFDTIYSIAEMEVIVNS